jgi:hypothetical protein
LFLYFNSCNFSPKLEKEKASTPPEIHIDSSPSKPIDVKGISNGMSSITKHDRDDKADPDDNEVQEILGKSVGAVEVLVEVNNNPDKNEEEGNRKYICFIIVKKYNIILLFIL